MDLVEAAVVEAEAVEPVEGFKMKARFIAGFTLIELMLAVSILAICLCGILLTYINMYMMSDLSRDFTLVNSAIQAKMEEAKKTSYDNLSALNGATFDINGFISGNAKARIEVSDVTIRAAPAEILKKVKITSCFFKSRLRVVGEDLNCNGALDSGEDQNGNGNLDRPVELITLMAR